jgi:hypothetical protein
VPLRRQQEASPGGGGPPLTKIVNCQRKKPYGNCHWPMRPWERLTVPVSAPGHDHRVGAAGREEVAPGTTVKV